MRQTNDLSKSLTPFVQGDTLIAVIELSLSSWLVAGVVPGVARQPLKKLEPDEAELLRLLQRWRDEAVKSGCKIERVVVAYEAGRDGFWLARWLQQHGVEVYVMQPSSVPVDRRMRRAKSDRIDVDMLLRTLLAWLRGGPLPSQGAVELLEENVAVFYGAPAEDEKTNGKALREALDELVRAQVAARSDDRRERYAEASGLTERERRRFGLRLDELRQAQDMTIGDLSARSGIDDVVSIVGFIYGAEEAGSSEMMSLAAALEAEPRELFPEFLAGSEDDAEGGDL